MAGNPKTSKSTSPAKAISVAGSKGTKVGLNPKVTPSSTAVVGKGKKK
jgi:hypothetical protein